MTRWLLRNGRPAGGSCELSARSGDAGNQSLFIKRCIVRVTHLQDEAAVMTAIVKTCGADSRPRVSSALDGSHLTEHAGDFPARCPQMNRARCQESARFIEGNWVTSQPPQQREINQSILKHA